MVKIDALSLANYIIDNQVGQRTVIYPYVEGEIKRLEQEGVWGEETTAFLEEFLFFEDDYAYIYKDIGDQPVWDLGCQLGFGSLFFSHYTGVDFDLNDSNWFNSHRGGVKYIKSNALTLKDDLVNQVIICNMVAGFFGEDTKDDEWLHIIEQSKSFSGRVHRRIYERLNPKYVTQLAEYDEDPMVRFISPLITYTPGKLNDKWVELL